MHRYAQYCDVVRERLKGAKVKLLGHLSVLLFADVTTNNLGLLWMKLKFAF
jgi:hypothetical protein